MTYYDSAEGVNISRARVVQELKRHGVPENEHAEFFAECGERTEYDAQQVLNWLGY